MESQTQTEQEDEVPLHPIAKKTRASLRRAMPDRYGMVSATWDGPAMSTRVAPATIDRATRLWDTFLRAFEKTGGTVTFSRRKEPPYVDIFERSTKINGFEVLIQLKERWKQTPHKVTAEDRKKKYTDPPKFDYQASGILFFEVGEDWRRPRWSDRKRKQLEDQINDVVQGMVDAAEAKRQQEERWKIEEKERLERQRREWEAEQRRREEQKKIDQLMKYVENWQRSRQIREFMADAKETLEKRDGPILENSEFHEIYTWSLAYAERIDPLRKEG